MKNRMKPYYGTLIDDNNTVYIKEYPGCFRENAIKDCMCVGTDLDTMYTVADAMNARMSGHETYVEHFDYENADFYFGEKTDVIGESIAHPAYGLLEFSRRSGGRGKALFGSSIEHNDTISMSLKQGKLTRGLNTDWYNDIGTIVEVEMSYAQFADAITSLNISPGVPCTIRFQKGVGMLPHPEFTNKRDQYTQELKSELDKNAADAKEIYHNIAEMFATKSSIGKGDRESILKAISKLIDSFDSHATFAYQQFQEQMDNTIHEAKCEVEAFTQNKLLSIAQQALVEHAEDLTKLDSPVDMSCLEAHNE